MKLKDVKKVGVIGAGTMGPSIAAAIAPKYQVIVKEVDQAHADKGLEAIKKCFPALVRRGAITEVQQEVAISQVTMTTDLKAMKDCQVIIDSVPDILELKTGLFIELNKICDEDHVFATTSSLMSVTAIAQGSGSPDRFIGTHFNIPAHLMELVEVAPAIQTSQETTEFMMTFLKDGLGKKPILCKDSPGYIVNFLFFPWLIRAIKALELGLGTVEDIDNAIKLGIGHKMGPFELMDMFGHHNNVTGFQRLYDQLHDDAYAVPPLLMKLYEAGYLGKSTGKGWYIYDEQGKKIGINKMFSK